MIKLVKVCFDICICNVVCCCCKLSWLINCNVFSLFGVNLIWVSCLIGILLGLKYDVGGWYLIWCGILGWVMRKIFFVIYWVIEK